MREKTKKRDNGNALDKVVPQGADGILHNPQGEAESHGIIDKVTLALLLGIEGLLGNEVGESPICLVLCESVVCLWKKKNTGTNNNLT